MAIAPRSRYTLQSASWEIGQLPGLSASDCERLTQAGIQTTLQLLRQAHTAEQRLALAARLQVHVQHVNKWVALADLARVPSVGCQHCGLLLHAGVGSPLLLAQTSIARLYQQILKLHVATLQRRDLCPTLGEVEGWIQQAQQLVWRDRQRASRRGQPKTGGGG